MATPKNKITGNIQQSTGIEVSSSPSVPPTDGNTNAAVDGSIATSASGLYQRTEGTWKALSENSNSARGRFICGTLQFTGTSTNASIALPAGASNGDRVFITADSASVNTDTDVVTYSAQCALGNLVITARNSAGVATATAGTPSFFFMIDTAT